MYNALGIEIKTLALCAVVHFDIETSDVLFHPTLGPSRGLVVEEAVVPHAPADKLAGESRLPRNPRNPLELKLHPATQSTLDLVVKRRVYKRAVAQRRVVEIVQQLVQNLRREAAKYIVVCFVERRGSPYRPRARVQVQMGE
jgi:hypothetical protein